MSKLTLLILFITLASSIYSKEIEKVEIYGRKLSQESYLGITPIKFDRWVSRIDTIKTSLHKISDELFVEFYDENVTGFYVTTIDSIFIKKVHESLGSLAPIESKFKGVDVRIYMKICYSDQTIDECYLGYPNTQFNLKKYNTNWQLLGLAYEKSPVKFHNDFLFYKKLNDDRN